MPFVIVQVQNGQIALVDSDGNPVGISANPLRCDPTGDTTQPISATSLPLPSGAATESTLGNIKTKTDNIPSDPAKESGKLTTIDTTLTAIKSTDGIKKIVDALPTGTNTLGKIDQGAAGATAWKTDGSGVTQPISATALPLPTGAATETTLVAIKNTDGIKKIVDALPAGTNTLGKIDQGAAGATAWKTDGSGVTQPVSATSLPLPTGAATETTLAAIKNTDGVKKIVDALPTGDNRIGRVKVTDDTNVLGVDAQGAAYVSGKSAVGVAPSSNPVFVSGIDGGGLKRALLTDTAGKLQVVMGSGGYGGQVEGLAADGATPVGNPVLIGGQDGTNVQSIKTDNMGRIETVPAARPYQLPLMIDLFYRATEGAVVATQFKRVLTYTIPTGYSAYLVQFSSWQNETAYSRLVLELSMGTLNVATNAFVDGSAYTSPQFAGTVEAEVTTQFGAANNVTVTVTYVNQSGVAGRTGTFTIPKSSVVGTRIVMALQAGDFGVRDITALSAAPSGGAGAIKVLGFLTLTWHSNLATTTGIITQYQPGAISMPEGTVLGVEYAGGTAAKERVFDVNVQLVQ